MTEYTPKTTMEWRLQKGTQAKKLAAEFAKIDGHTVKVAKVPVTGGGADDIAIAWLNPVSAAVIVTRVVVDITTAGGTSSSVLDIGTAADADTGSDNLIDGANANAVAVYDNVDDQGTNGTAKQKVPAGEYVTGQIKAAAAQDLAGTAYICYIPVP